jgi:hypothetical protein
VYDIPYATAQQLAALAMRNLQLQCLAQDGHAQLLTDAGTVDVELASLK